MAPSNTKYSRYPVYKESGEYWIGQIPDHWEIEKLKYIFQEKKKKSNPTLSSGSISFGKVVYKDDDKVPKSTKASYQEVLAGEFLVNPLNLNYDLVSLRIGLSTIDVVVSSGYLVLTNLMNIEKGYFKYLLHRYDVAYMKLLGSGVRQTISFTHIANSLLAIPPLTEQTAIANFLDEKTSKIDQAIAQKEKMITLLKERKQIIIQNAVTKGLDPDVKMKDSGVERIGEIPEHWETKRCKYLFFEVDDRSEDGSEELLSVSHITGVTARSEKEVSMFLAEDYSGSKLCKKGDVVYNIMWAWMGALGVSRQTGIVSPSYGIYRQNSVNAFNGEFLEYKLKSSEYIQHYNKVSTGLHTSRLRFYSHMFMNMEISYPNRAEQDEIMLFVEGQSKKVDKAMTLLTLQIEKLKEYKATLIDSAVTGKIKVS